MLKRIAAIALTAALAVGFLTSCVGTTSTGTTTTTTTTTTTAPKTGSLTTLVGDAPGVCDAVSFPLVISDFNLSGPNGAGTTPINADLVNPPLIRINLGCLRDFTTVLNASPANPGTYDTAQVWFIEPQLIFFDPTILPPNPPQNTAQLTINPSNKTGTTMVQQIPLSPPVTITKGAASVVQIDFDMLHSIQSITTDLTTGQLTVTATPQITVTSLSAAGSQGQGFGEVDDLAGFVRSVTIAPPGNISLYAGSFALQLLSSSITGPPVVAVNLSSSSLLYGFTALNELVTDSFMEVDGYIDVDANFVATSVEDEYVENPAQNKVALIGPVTSVTRGPAGNVTSFNLWARDVEPYDPALVLPETIVQVNLTASTTYQYSSRSVNFANVSFGPSNIAVGQEAVVHGPITKPTSPPIGSTAPSLLITVAADKVYDKLQSIQGGFSSLVQIANDNKTGAFTFVPCSTMFQGTSAMVLTSNQTAFVNLTGLSSLAGNTSRPTLVVKGLPFYEQQAQTIYGVPVPAGTLVILAKQVHQIQ